MGTDILISAEEALRRLEDGAAMLVCAYDDEAHCEELALEESITWPEYQTYRSEIPPKRDVILFCASEDADLAVDRAVALRDEGKENAFAIDGGYDAARDAGLAPEE